MEFSNSLNGIMFSVHSSMIHYVNISSKQQINAGDNYIFTLLLISQDLELALSKFYETMKNSTDVPSALKGKEGVIFGNLQDICNFHRNIFLKELEKYETMPEDVGHCFVTWVSWRYSIYIYPERELQRMFLLQASKFDIYVYYCTNKPKSTELLVAHGSPYFENLQKAAGVDQPLAAYLIKPVQR